MRGPSLIDLPDLEWIELMRAECGKPGNTITSIARELGEKRCSISLLLSGNYPAKLDKVTRRVAPKVMKLYAHRVWCPHLMASISTDACQAFASAPMSISDPLKARHYRACRSCPQNPRTEKVTDAG